MGLNYANTNKLSASGICFCIAFCTQTLRLLPLQHPRCSLKAVSTAGPTLLCVRVGFGFGLPFSLPTCATACATSGRDASCSNAYASILNGAVLGLRAMMTDPGAVHKKVSLCCPLVQRLIV